MRPLINILRALAFLSVPLLSPLPALAQPKKAAPLTEAEADRLYEEGTQLRDAKNYRGALEKFLELRLRRGEDRLGPIFLVEIAELYEKTCDLVRAEEDYRTAANRQIDLKKSEIRINEQRNAQAKAKKQLAALQKRTPKIDIITQHAPPDTLVLVNNQPVTRRSLPKPLYLAQNPGFYWIDAVAGRKWTRFGPFELKEGMNLQLTVLGRGDSLAIFDDVASPSSRARDVPAGGPPLIPKAALARGSACAVEEEEEEETATPSASAPRAPITTSQPATTTPSISTTTYLVSGGLLYIGALTGAMWYGLTAADANNQDAATTFGVISIGTLLMGASVGMVGFIIAPTEKPVSAAGRVSAAQPPLSVSVGPGAIRIHGTF